MVECLKSVARVEAVRLEGLGRSVLGAIVKVRWTARIRVVKRRVMTVVAVRLRMVTVCGAQAQCGTLWLSFCRMMFLEV